MSHCNSGKDSSPWGEEILRFAQNDRGWTSWRSTWSGWRGLGGGLDVPLQ